MNDEKRDQRPVEPAWNDDPYRGFADAEPEVRQRANNVLDLFHEVVDSDRSAPAVSWKGVDTSYGELDELSSQVANALIATGASQGSIVAIFLSNPVHQIVATLGCLKAGCVFASLDFSHPPQRLLHMLEIVGARWVILEASTGSAFSGLLKAMAGAPNILVMGEDCVFAEDFAAHEAGVHQVAVRSTDRVAVPTAPDDPCYIYFTSGSTGKPKAIVGRIRGLAHFIQWEIATFELGPASRVSQLTGPSFDVYLRDVFAPLCSAGTVCIPPTAKILDPILLERWIEQARITLIHCVPSVFRLLLRQDLVPEKFPALKFVLLAGESLAPADANRWIACFGQRIRLVNLYGPTETTLAKFCYQLPAMRVVDTFVPIGKPIPGAQAILLDESLAPCGPGELGEIFIRTPYRTLGYHNAPDLTATAFIRNPFAGGTDDVLYRTGDLARLLPDGNFRFAGRKDFQVKINGTRIELGEIESRLQECPGVCEAVVLAREDNPGETRLVAYYVPRPSGSEGAAVSAPDLRKHLIDLLPPIMVPALYVALERLPLSVNGKVDRSALPAPGVSRPELAIAYAPPIDGDERQLCEAFAATLGIERVGRHDSFFELGGNSLLALRLLARIQESAAEALPATLIFGNPTPATLAIALASGAGGAIDASRLPRGHRSAGGPSGQLATADQTMANEPVAIIAMAGRFPGAGDVEQFWDNLCAGRDSITVFPRDELDPSIAAVDRLDPAYVPARGIIDGVENFDAGFFGVSPREAELMDPQHRIFLELCWEAMERGGEVPDATTVPVGVFAGTYHTTYLRRHVAAHPDLVENVGAYQVTLANEKDYIATRIAHKLNLTGPAISMYTACSTSLVAICQAVDSLRAGSCDMALAGGSSIICPPRSGYRYQEGAMFSPDGHTRTFDAQAQGTVFSDGAAVVLLKRLSDAVRDGNPVHAVILGGAVNNDGGGKASFTAPSSEGQAAVIAMAQANACVSPRSISYVEAHGTATPMGDPIEIEGLVKAFRRGTSDAGFCRVGSVKSNVGHLVIAAGAAGVIKTALALEQGRIPPSLHFERANPAIDFSDSPFVVNADLSAWTSDGGPLRAGVSSFGVGGTNAHVVLEQAPPLPDSEAGAGPNLLVLSARSPAALANAAERLADFLQADLERSASGAAAGAPATGVLNLADVAWTLMVGRKAFPHRVALTATQAQEAIAQLRAPGMAAAIKRSAPARHCEPVFMFPGQGSHYAGMGSALYEAEPEFAAAFDQCAEVLSSHPGLDLRRLVFGDDPTALLPTAVMQPAIFSVEYALARLWMSRGVVPAAMIGHSVGEFVAATLAGVFTLPDALRLVARRGELMQAQPPGGMLSVRISLETLCSRLPAGLSLAAENAPDACVVAGPVEAIAEFQAQLGLEGIACRTLRTSHAFHSAMMEPVIAPFLAEVTALKLSAPSLPLVSTATGNWLDAATATSPHYWARHLREPVRFASALGRVIDSPSRVLLEVGPRGTLSALARQHPVLQHHHTAAVASLADSPANEIASFRLAVGQLWARGFAFDPAAFDRRTVRRRVRLPTYPFERERFWVEATPAVAANVIPQTAKTELRRFAGPGDAPAVSAPTAETDPGRRAKLLAQTKAVFEEFAGFRIADDDGATSFMELGLDSLMLTQFVLRLQRTFATGITFRQLMGEYSSLDRLVDMLDTRLPPEAVPSPQLVPTPAPVAVTESSVPVRPVSELVEMAGNVDDAYLRQLIERQMRLMEAHVALLMGGGASTTIPVDDPVVAQPEGLATETSTDLAEVAEPVAPVELQPAPRRMTIFRAPMDAAHPPAPGAKLGRDREGQPGWFVSDPTRAGRFLKVLT